MARLEVVSSAHEKRITQHDADIRQLQEFWAEMRGAARAGARSASLWIGAASILVTVFNILLAHWG